MLYWLPRTGASSARLYWESLDDVGRWLEGPVEAQDLVDVPTLSVVRSFKHGGVVALQGRLWTKPRIVLA
jgi:hypothetical protein